MMGPDGIALTLTIFAVALIFALIFGDGDW